MQSSPAKELLNHLGHRGEVLEAISNGTDDKRVIADKIGKSRSSIDRDIRILKNSGFINEHEKGYRLNNFGEFALQIYGFANNISKCKGIAPHFPPSVPFEVVKEANIRKSGGTVPHGPSEHMIELINSAHRVNIAVPVVCPSLNEVLSIKSNDEKLAADILVTEDVLDELMASYPEQVQACLGSPDYSLWKTNSELSFGILVADRNVASLIIYDESLRQIGTLTTRSNVAIEWGLDRFGNIVSKADEIFLRGGSSGRKYRNTTGI